MSTTREVTIWCDDPDCTEWEQFAGTVADARKHLKRYGWTYKLGRDICGECASED